MKRTYPINLILGASVVILYVTFAGASFSRFPSSYSPFDNWLSDLGNPDLNITGAIFYNTGIILAGISLLFFFLYLTKLRLANNRLQRIMTVLTVGFGSIGSLAMIMTAVYPIDQPAQHSFWSMILYFSLGTAFAFSVAALRYHTTFPRWLLLFGGIAAFINMVAQIFFTDICISEWIVVPLLLSYCLFLGIGVESLQTKNTKGDKFL